MQVNLSEGEEHKDITKNKKFVFKNPFWKKTKKLPELSESNDNKLGADAHVQELPQEKSSYPLFVAKFDYASRTDDDLGFKKGDSLYIINTDDDDWWFAKAKHSNQEGYIPSNYVAEFNSLEAEE